MQVAVKHILCWCMKIQNLIEMDVELSEMLEPPKYMAAKPSHYMDAVLFRFYSMHSAYSVCCGDCSFILRRMHIAIPSNQCHK